MVGEIPSGAVVCYTLVLLVLVVCCDDDCLACSGMREKTKTVPR